MAATISAQSACLHPPGSSMEWWHDSSPSCERVGSAKADGTAGRFASVPITSIHHMEFRGVRFKAKWRFRKKNNTPKTQKLNNS